MNENMIDLKDLMFQLGYEDERSVKKWCKNNKIPILKMGLKKYILSQFLTQNIDNQLLIFAKANFLNPDLLIEKSREKKPEDSKLAADIKENTKKPGRSEASLRFLKNIKAA